MNVILYVHVYMLTKLCFLWASCTFISRSSHCTMFDCFERAKTDAASNQKLDGVESLERAIGLLLQAT